MNVKKFSVFFATLSLFFFIPSQKAFSWGNPGHSTIAYIAEQHLTPKARKAIEKYVGLHLAAIASDADSFRGQWTMDLGFIPTNPEAARVAFVKSFDFSTPLNISPWSHSITVDENFKCFPTDNLDGAYINNAAYYMDRLSKQLREDAENMDPYERYKAISLIVHLMGDMHCPMHVVYLGRNTLKGKIKIKFRGKETTLHTYWDDRIFDSYFPKDFIALGYLADNGSKKDFKEITSGTVYDWAGRTAEKSWHCHVRWKDGDSLPARYDLEEREFFLGQLRDAGYRLAALLNETFK